MSGDVSSRLLSLNLHSSSNTRCWFILNTMGGGTNRVTAPAAVSFVSQKLTVSVLFQLSDRIEVKNDSETANMEET